MPLTVTNVVAAVVIVTAPPILETVPTPMGMERWERFDTYAHHTIDYNWGTNNEYHLKIYHDQGLSTNRFRLPSPTSPGSTNENPQARNPRSPVPLRFPAPKHE